MSSSYKLRGEQYLYPTVPGEQAYDNKAYQGRGYYPGSQAYAQPAHHYAQNPMPREDSRRQQQNKRCLIIVVVIITFILIAAAIAVGVYFGVRSDDDKDDQPAVATTVQMSMSLDKPWNDDLRDPTSQAYQTEKQFVEDGINKLMEDVEEFESVRVTGFSEGSIVCDFNLAFKEKNIIKSGERRPITNSLIVEVLNEKVEEKKGSNELALAVDPTKTTAQLLQGGVGSVDLGGSCNSATDCEDKNVECVGSPTKVCTCKVNYYNPRNQGGKCYASKVYGGTCSMNRECAYVGGECKSSKCDCEATRFRHDNACKTKIDIDRIGCTQDTHCKYPGAVCEMLGAQGTCRCPSDKFVTTDRCSPKLDIGRTGCTNDNQCVFGKCLSGTCNCETGTVPDQVNKQCVSDVSVCDPEHFRQMMTEDCGNSWTSYESLGDPRQFEMFLGCMWFQAFVHGQQCNLETLLSNLRKSDMHKGLASMQLGTCTQSWTPNVGKDVEVVFTTSNTDGVAVQIIVPNDMVVKNKWIGFGVSNDAFMPSSVMYTFENFADPSSFVMNLRYATARQRPEVRSPKIQEAFRFRVRHGDQYTSIMFEQKKTDTLEGLSLTGQRHFLFAYGDIDPTTKQIDKHTRKAVSPSKLNLDCARTDNDRLSELLQQGVQTKKDLCTNKWTVRYIVEYECLKPIPSYTQEEKCIVRLAAKYCVQRHLSEAGIACTLDELETTFQDPFVTWKLMTNYPGKSCEAGLSLSTCELAWLAKADQLFECEQPLMMATMVTKFWPNFASKTSAAGSQLLKCSLWKGVFQCLSRHLVTSSCSAQDIQEILGRAIQMAQRYLANTVYLQSVVFDSPADFTIIDYADGCSLTGFTPQVATCPANSLVADVILAACSTEILYRLDLNETYPFIDKCSVDIMGCSHEHIEGMFQLFECSADIDTVLPQVFTEYSSWFEMQYGYDVARCVDLRSCWKLIEPHQDCLSVFGIFAIEDKLKDRNEKCASAQLIANELMPACFSRHNIPERCGVQDLWNDAVSRHKQKVFQTGLDQCLDEIVDICEALTITTLFKCYGLHYMEGPCSIDDCIHNTTAPSGLSCAVDTDAVYERAISIYGSKPECDRDLHECIGQLRQHADCMGVFGLADIEDKLENKNEKCASVHLVKNEILPACMTRHNLPQKCHSRIDDIWTTVLRAHMEAEGLHDSELWECDEYEADQCAAATITTLFRCYGLYAVDGDCRTDQCIKNATSVCGDPIDTVAVYRRANDIYETPPLCDCGKGAFEAASTILCAPAWQAWLSLTGTQKCAAYEAFIGCIAFNLLVRGKSVCGFETIHQNILADASKAGHNPDVCSTGASKYDDLDAMFPADKDAVCTNTMVYRSLLAFFCPADPNLFTGTDSRSKCMSEVARKTCVYVILQSSGLTQCTDDIAWETMGKPEVRNGILDLSPGCEYQYPCTVSVLDEAEKYGICLYGLNQFLYMSDYKDIDSIMAFKSTTEKLKCRVWDVATACVLSMAGQCMTQVQDVQDAMKILANLETGPNPVAKVKANIFDECTAFQPPDNCPTNNEALYSVLAYCGYGAMKPYNEGKHTAACVSLLICSAGVKAGFSTTCPNPDPYFEQLSNVEQAGYIRDVTGMICTPEMDPDVIECVNLTVKDGECSQLLGLLYLNDKLKNKDEKCSSVHLIKDHLLPACYRRKNMPEKCQRLSREVWRVVHNAFKQEHGIQHWDFDCEGYSGNPCATTTILTLFKCYALHPVEGNCGVNSCIKSATAPAHCQKQVDIGAVYERALDIYGGPPLCECGVGVFDAAVLEMCEEAWEAWMTATGSEKCQAYEAFLGCTAFNMFVKDVDFCGFATLHTNILADASKKGYNPTLCGTAAALDEKFPTTKAEMCNNTFAYRTILKYFCPAPATLFAGNQEKQMCMAEISSKLCLLNLFTVAGLQCQADTIWVTAAKSEVRNGIFTQQAGCEESYPCTIELLTKAEVPNTVSNCQTGMGLFLALSGMGVDINNTLAKGPTTEKMKCRAWEVLTNCVLIYVNTSCWSDAGIADLRSGLQVLSNAYPGSADIPGASKVDIFNECPAGTAPTATCPTNDELVYATIGYCGLSAVYIYRTENDVDKACTSVLECSKEIVEGYRTFCPNISTYFGKLMNDENREYFRTVTGISCPEPEKDGNCPSPGGQVGTCEEECENDYSCPDNQKCCSNGCGHTCQIPANQ